MTNRGHLAAILSGTFFRVVAVILATAAFAHGQELPKEETFIGGGTQPSPDGIWAPGSNTGGGTVVAPQPIVVAPQPIVVAPQPIVVTPQPIVVTPQPIRYEVFPVSLTLRSASEASDAKGAKVVIADLPAKSLANLALGRAPGTPLASHEILALALGDSTPAGVRLIVFDRQTSTQLALIAHTLKLDLAKGYNRNVGLLKFNFMPGGSGSDAIQGGSFQLASQTFSSRRMMSLLAHGNGELQFSRNGVVSTSVLTSVSLRVLSKAVGQFDE